MTVNFKFFYITALFIFLSIADLIAGTIDGKFMLICDDGAEWPPYTYYKRVDGKKTKEIIGYSVDVIKEIFTEKNIKFQVELPPWARCLNNLKQGGYQMALNASYSQERGRDYLLTRAYYSTRNFVFYSKKQFPEGLKIQHKTDLKKYRVCGLHGYNYETYGLQNDKIDRNAYNFPQLIEKLHRNRCDLFVDKFEIIMGFSDLGQNFLEDPSFGFEPIPRMEHTSFYMLISRQLSYADELKAFIDQRLEKLEKNGVLLRIAGKYSLIR